MKLKTGDKVVVIAGSNKGKEGKIIKKLEDRVIIEGVNLRKKHLKPKNNGGNGEIVETEAPAGYNLIKEPREVIVKKDRQQYELIMNELKNTRKN